MLKMRNTFYHDYTILKLRFHNGMKANNYDQIKSLIKSKIISIEKIIFDLKELENITSSFLQLCLFSIKSIGINNFKLININSADIIEYFKASGFNTILSY